MSKPNFITSFHLNQDPPSPPFKISHLVLKCLKNGSNSHNEFHEFPHLKLKAFLPSPKQKTLLQMVSGERLPFNKKFKSASPSPKHQRKHSEDNDVKKRMEEEKKLKEKLKSLGNAIKNSFICCDKFTIEVCFKILHQISKNLKLFDPELDIEDLIWVLQKSVFYQEENLKNVIEDIFGVERNFIDKIWKDVVKDVCFLANELKTEFEKKIKEMMLEISTIREENNFYKEEKNEFEKKLISEERNFKNNLEAKITDYEEKISQQRILIQKISNENAKLKNQQTHEFDVFFKEREKSEFISQKNILNLSQQVEDLKKQISQKEKQIVNLELEHNQTKLDLQKILNVSKESKIKSSSAEKQIAILTRENDALKERISLSQAELTPRPNFDKFRNFLNVSESFFENKSTKTNMENLFAECKKHDQIYSSKPISFPKTPTVIFSYNNLNKLDCLSTMEESRKNSIYVDKNNESSFDNKSQIDKKCLGSGFKSKKLKIITKFETKEKKKNGGVSKSPRIICLPAEFHEEKMNEIELLTK